VLPDAAAAGGVAVAVPGDLAVPVPDGLGPAAASVAVPVPDGLAVAVPGGLGPAAASVAVPVPGGLGPAAASVAVAVPGGLGPAAASVAVPVPGGLAVAVPGDLAVAVPGGLGPAVAGAPAAGDPKVDARVFSAVRCRVAVDPGVRGIFWISFFSDQATSQQFYGIFAAPASLTSTNNKAFLFMLEGYLLRYLGRKKIFKLNFLTITRGDHCRIPNKSTDIGWKTSWDVAVWPRCIGPLIRNSNGRWRSRSCIPSLLTAKTARPVSDGKRVRWLD
jgi:hypothetical protein